MSERLAEFYAASQEEAQRREVLLPFQELEWMIAELPEPQVRFEEALVARSDVAVIAEHKRQSPSIGEISRAGTLPWTVEQYQQGGAVALSIVTQGAHFGGRVEDLTDARHSSDLPILRKDFIRTPYQLYESRAHGANAVLLIVAGLSDTDLLDLHEEARDIGLGSLIEVHDEEELQRALEVSPSLIGINNRNLSTLQVDLDTTCKLMEAMPATVTVVAESGYDVRNRAHMRELQAMGADAVLMGTALMREENPAEALASWLAP
jgi:indole-3-glycerol phosphate synthase